jgi:hypothetical protein
MSKKLNLFSRQLRDCIFLVGIAIAILFRTAFRRWRVFRWMARVTLGVAVVHTLLSAFEKEGHRRWFPTAITPRSSGVERLHQVQQIAVRTFPANDCFARKQGIKPKLPIKTGHNTAGHPLFHGAPATGLTG